MVRGLQLQEERCASLASLQLCCSGDLLNFLGSCWKVIVPSTSALAFHFPPKHEGRRCKAQFSPQQCSLGGFTPSQTINLFLHWLCFCHGVATWRTLSLGGSAL